MQRHYQYEHLRIGLASAMIVALSTACSHRGELDAIERTQVSENPNPASHGNGLLDGTTILTPNAPVLTVLSGNFTHYDEHDRSLTPELIRVSDQPFTFAQRFPYGSGDGTKGSAGYFGPVLDPIERHDLLRAFFWARCRQPQPNTDKCRSELVFEQTAHPYLNGGLEFLFRVGTSWTFFSEVFLSKSAFVAGEVQLTFRLGYPTQELELGPIGLENYTTSLPLEQLEALDEDPFTEVLATDSFAHYGDAVFDEPEGMDYPFGKATRFNTNGLTFAAPRDSGFQGRTRQAVAAQDLLLAVFWACCFASVEADGHCKTSVVFEESQSPYINAGLDSPSISISPRWRQYFLPFRVSRNYDADKVKLGFRLGYADQTIGFGPIELRQYDPSFQHTDMPQTPL